MASKYTIVLELSGEDIWDREIIASLSKVPAEYATPLLKSEILKWSRGIGELTSINSLGLDLDKTLLRLSGDVEVVREVAIEKEAITEPKKHKREKKEKVVRKKISFDETDVVVEDRSSDGVDSMSMGDILKMKIKGSYAA